LALFQTAINTSASRQRQQAVTALQKKALRLGLQVVAPSEIGEAVPLRQ